MVPFDLMLTLVGFVLIGIGVYVFLSGRKRRIEHDGEPNQFEAFGIRIAVSNPAVLLIMFGVVLVLTPRFVPDKGKDSDLAGTLAQVQESLGLASAETEPRDIEPPADRIAPVEAEVEPASSPRPVVVSEPATTPVAPAPLKTEPAPKPVVAAKPPPAVKPPAPPAAPKVVRAPPPVAAVVKAPQPAPALPALRTAVLTDATASVEGVPVSVYRQKMKQELDGVAEELLAGRVTVSGANPGFRKVLRLERIKEFCRQWEVDAIFYAEVEPAAFEMGIESGNWPDAVFMLAECGQGIVRESRTIGLSPSEGDRFPFHKTLIRAARVFYNQHLGLLQP